jgi:uncharacterized protein (DUF58 family)
VETAELIKKVRRLQILTSHLVSETLSGNYHSAFRGSGMEFDKVREYQVGDDIRNIDWNVTARSGTPHIKSYIEEREMTVMLLVDGSSSVAFGSGSRSKLELATELAAVLAFSATSNGDKVGLILFTDQVQLYLPPQKGRQHVLRLIREVLSFKPQHASTDLATALEFLGRVQKRRSVAFVVSDFLDQNFNDQLSVTSSRHDLIAVRVADQREVELPNMGLIRLEDSETGRQILIDTSSKKGREQYKHHCARLHEALDTEFKRRKIDHVNVTTNEDYMLPLRLLFKKREKKR